MCLQIWGCLMPMRSWQLAHAIRQRLKDIGLTQTAAAERLGTDQGKISNLVNGKISGFTLDRLLRYLNSLEVDVRIIVEPKSNHDRGKTLVTIA
jgi:predicted XRE-type DNA-binding protein